MGKGFDELQAIWSAWLFRHDPPYPIYFFRLDECLPTSFPRSLGRTVELADLLSELNSGGLIEETLDRTVGHLVADWQKLDTQTQQAILEAAARFRDVRFSRLEPLSTAETGQPAVPWTEAEQHYLGKRAGRLKALALQGLDLDAREIHQVGREPIGNVVEQIPGMIADLVRDRAKWDVAVVMVAAPGQFDVLRNRIVRHAQDELAELRNRAVESVRSLKPEDERYNANTRLALADLSGAIDKKTLEVIDALQDPWKWQSLIDDDYVKSIPDTPTGSGLLPPGGPPGTDRQPTRDPGEAPPLVKWVRFFMTWDNWKTHGWVIAPVMLLVVLPFLFPFLPRLTGYSLVAPFSPWILTDDGRVDAVLMQFSPVLPKDSVLRERLVFELRQRNLTLPGVIEKAATAPGAYSSTLPSDRKRAAVRIYRDTLGCVLSDAAAETLVAGLSTNENLGNTEDDSKRLFELIIHDNMEEATYARAWGNIDRLPLALPLLPLPACSK